MLLQDEADQIGIVEAKITKQDNKRRIVKQAQQQSKIQVKQTNRTLARFANQRGEGVRDCPNQMSPKKISTHAHLHNI